MKLIIENVEDVKYLTEAAGDGKKKLYIEGTYLVGESVNKNNRKYKMDTLRREVRRYNEEYVTKNRALGELGHPNTFSINLDRVSHKILSLEEDGNSFRGKSLVLDTPCGKIVQNLIDSGVTLGVSSRAIGSLTMTKEGYNLVQDDFRLSTAADIVADPSAPGAFVNGIMEGKEFWFDQAKGTIIEDGVEQLHDALKKASRRKIEENTLNLFDWYLRCITVRK